MRTSVDETIFLTISERVFGSYDDCNVQLTAFSMILCMFVANQLLLRIHFSSLDCIAISQTNKSMAEMATPRGLMLTAFGALNYI